MQKRPKGGIAVGYACSVRVIGMATAACLLMSVVLPRACAVSVSASASGSQQEATMQADTTGKLLESGFNHLYELKFEAARTDFFAYQKARPEDPLGKAAESASYLFEQFNQ